MYMEASCYGCERYIFLNNKYKGPHTCVNACLNRDHQQLDSNLVADHIKAMIKAQLTLSITTIQTTIMEKFGYEISYKNVLVGNHKALTILFGDFRISHMQNCHVSLWHWSRQILDVL